MTLPKEEKFEDHFCERLEKNGYRKRKNGEVDLNYNIDDGLLLEFLEKTQSDELKGVREDAGEDWFKQVKELIKKSLEKKKLFEVLREGITIERHHLRLLYFKPATTLDKEATERYESNIFSYIRQFQFRETQESIDIVLFLNGIAIITIELKSPFNGQVVDDAVVQYINDRDKRLPIFKTPIVHIAADTKKAMITTEFIYNTMQDFVPFNKDVENPEVEGEYQVEYLYNEILVPDSLTEIIEHYLYTFELELVDRRKIQTFFFPRYHQRRTVIKLTKDIESNFRKNKKLDLKYLIQHSAGSGKSYTIAVVQKFLRYLHFNNKPIFDSIVIVTDRINLDKQLRGTITATESQQGIIVCAKDTTKLAEALNKNTKVIISTIQKFSVKKLDEILKSQKDKKICFIIDEVHRSQTGKLRRNMLGHFEPEEENVQEKIMESFTRRKFPSFVFIGLTSTPSDKIISMFGKPFDVYSMDQAEKEGYILSVSDNIVTYRTLYELSNYLKNEEEYPQIIIAKKLKNKAYEDDNVILQKIDIILKIFEAHTKYSIKDYSAKSMIVTCSRKAAVKYKLLLDKVLKEKKLNYKTLVAFSGSVQLKWNEKECSFTESNLNNIKEDIEDEFKKSEYRFLIVANKFQYGFNEPLLHTMFLDKSVSGINAVQTISRLDRIFPNKTDTLVVDFTDSYEKIIKAFRKFKKEVNDYYGITITELMKLHQEIMNMGIFTQKDIQEFIKVSFSAETNVHLENIASRIESTLNKKLSVDERRNFRALLNKFNNTYNYLNNLIKIENVNIRDFVLFVYYMYNYLNPEGKSRKLDEELKKVYVKSHRIELKKTETTISETTRKGNERIVVYATVREVVDAINNRFNMVTSDNEKTLIENYMNDIVNDKDIQEDLLANKGKNLNDLYEKTIAKKLRSRFIQFFMLKNPEKVPDYLNSGLNKFINFEAFRLSAGKLGL